MPLKIRRKIKPSANSTQKKPSKKQTEIRTVSDLLNFVETNCDTDVVLFRGQNADWPLQPKLARLKSRDGDVLELEKKLMKDFKRLSKPYLNRIPQNEWEWLAVAQHHGLATRLLDWTTNPLTALWFAVCRPAVKKANGVIWLFNVLDQQILQPDEIQNISPYQGPLIKVFQPEISTVRIQSQNGWFTVHKYDEKSKKIISSNPFSRNKNLPEKMKKLVIPYNVFGDLRDELDRLGVNELSLFQDIDGVASYVEWAHTLLDDEVAEEKVVINLKSPARYSWPQKR